MQADRSSVRRFLQDKKTGLFFHGWTDHEGGHNVGPVRARWHAMHAH
jgi:rhamnogalacturonyl hydrolase YesR